MSRGIADVSGNLYPARGRARSGRSCGFMLLFFMSRGIADVSKLFILLAGERDLVDLVEFLWHADSAENLSLARRRANIIMLCEQKLNKLKPNYAKQ